MDRQDILIRLLKEGHISSDEFKMLYEPLPIITSGYSQTTDFVLYPHGICPPEPYHYPNTTPIYGVPFYTSDGSTTFN